MLGWNQIVTFSNPRTNEQTGPVPVCIEDVTERIASASKERVWEVRYSPELRYPDGSKISAGHTVLWDYLASGQATITKPMPPLNGLGGACVRFKQEN